MSSIFFSGIGGIGMSALARFLQAQGHTISGSDSTDSPLLCELEEEGMQIFHTQAAENIPDDCVEFVYTEALPVDHVERTEANNRGIPQLSYFHKLGKVSQDFFTICIAGTHGKSTTTAMAGLALEKAGIDPTVILGTKVFEWEGKNFRKGASDILVVEACEYRESFLFLKTDIIILTTVEPEHLDYYKTAENYFRGFQKFIGKLSAQGTLIADFTDPIIQEISRKHKGNEISTHDLIGEVPELSLQGVHQRENASKVLALFQALNVPQEKVKKALQQFRGTWRRFEKKGEKDGVLVYDDYAHHPTEIQATLTGLQQTYPERKKWIVFQPHQYSRTAAFLNEFAESFAAADEILIPNIYRVRDTEEDVTKVSPEKLVQEIRKNISSEQNVRYTKDFETTVQILEEEVESGDVVMTMGAGPVHEVGEVFLGN